MLSELAHFCPPRCLQVKLCDDGEGEAPGFLSPYCAVDTGKALPTHSLSHQL